MKSATTGKPNLFKVGDIINGAFGDAYTVLGDAAEAMYDCIQEGVKAEMGEGMSREEAIGKVVSFYYVAQYNWDTLEWEERF